MSSLSLLSQQVASSARLVFQAAETEGKGLRAHRLHLLGERCLEIVVISKGSGSGGGGGTKIKQCHLYPVWVYFVFYIDLSQNNLGRLFLAIQMPAGSLHSNLSV